MDIDLNVIGKSGYNELRKTNLVPDKDKKDLTLTERKSILDNLNKLQHNLLEKHEDYSKDKYNFLMFLYASIICYIDNTDLNKFIKISQK